MENWFNFIAKKEKYPAFVIFQFDSSTIISALGVFNPFYCLLYVCLTFDSSDMICDGFVSRFLHTNPMVAWIKDINCKEINWKSYFYFFSSSFKSPHNYNPCWRQEIDPFSGQKKLSFRVNHPQEQSVRCSTLTFSKCFFANSLTCESFLGIPGNLFGVAARNKNINFSLSTFSPLLCESNFR